jgi:hypothetical protein
MSSTNLEFAMLSIGVFGTGLFTGLGSIAAGQASAAYKTAEASPEESASRAAAEASYIGHTVASVVYFAAMIAFIVLLSLSFYKKP